LVLLDNQQSLAVQNNKNNYLQTVQVLQSSVHVL